jgi:hypothetical protein
MIQNFQKKLFAAHMKEIYFMPKPLDFKICTSQNVILLQSEEADGRIDNL